MYWKKFIDLGGKMNGKYVLSRRISTQSKGAFLGYEKPSTKYWWWGGGKE